MKKLLLVIAAASLLSGCAKNMNSTTYSEGAVAGKVLEGKVISMRNVTIKAHAKLQDNTTGGLMGGTAGAVAGAQVGNGYGSTGAAVGGAIIGAVAGAMIEDAMSTSEGVEYLVKIDKKYLQEYKNISKRIESKGLQTVEQDMAGSTNVGTKSDIVSVVQAAEPGIQKGSRVYIIYNDDRPRLTLNDD